MARGTPYTRGMPRAVARLVVSAVLVAALAAALAILLALVVGGSFHDKLRLTLWLAAGMLLLFAATGSSPSMDRAIGQHARGIVGPLMGRPDESYGGTRPSTSAVLGLGALVLFAVSIAIGR
jgi:hypothetical protein